jgi:hypothetical protein
MLRRVPLLVPIVVLLSAGACSNDSVETTTVPNEMAVTTPAPTDDRRATSFATTTTGAAPGGADEAALLDPALLGPRFEIAAAPIDARTADSKLATLCPVVGRPRRAYAAETRERVVLRGRDPLPTVVQDLAVYADSNASASVFNSLVSEAMVRCFPKLVADSGLVLDDVRVTRVPIEPVGDAAAALRLRGTSITGGLASNIDVELIAVTVGPMVQVVVVTSSDLFPLGEDRRGAIVAALAS